MVKKQAAQAGGRLVRNIAEEVGEQLTRRPKPAAPGSDWGWRGAKPGEISGVDYFKNFPRSPAKAREWEGKFASQVDPINNLDWTPDEVADVFYSLENAGIPREWTGRVVKDLGLDFAKFSPKVKADVDVAWREPWQETTSRFAKELSSSMRPLSNEGREMLLKMLPDWEGSLDDLASTITAILS
jgi:hypothetical protein